VAENGDVWVVIPAFNEGAAIGSVIAGLRAYASKIVVVDDGSIDGTAGAAHEAGAIVLRHVINRGQGAALQTGIEYALRRGASTIVTFDSDGQHSPADVPTLVAPLRDGRADIVLGSRFLGSTESMPRLRRIVLYLAVLFTRMVSGLRVTDAHNGLRAFSRRAASMVHIQLDRMAHASELMDQIRRSGLVYTEVPVHVRYTEYSRQKGQRGVHAVRIAFDYFIGKFVR
jgi:glycosyltransferase involved in cell wall biosynthesis